MSRGIALASVRFEDLVRRATSKGIKLKTDESRNWFRNNIRKVKPSAARFMNENKEQLVNSWTSTGVGRFYMFFYDPKWKKELPYFDRFPLVIPIHYYNDGFLGLNLHYLPPAMRAKLLGALYDLENNTQIPERKKIKLTYGILKSAAKYRLFKPCIKRYLSKHIRSRFLKIPYESWEMAVFLPMDQFEKADRKTVWNDSKNIINGVK